jgi:putative two-component system response regulator
MRTIFIVDDNEANRVSAKVALGDAYSTYAMPSAAKMFELIEEITPDLILLDIEMPEMGGFEALEILKTMPAFKDIPVVFLTAKNDTTSVLAGIMKGVNDYITKPFVSEMLIERVEKHLMS